MKMMILNYQTIQFKITLKMQKSIIHQKTLSQMMKTFIKHNRRKPKLKS